MLRARKITANILPRVRKKNQPSEKQTLSIQKIKFSKKNK